MSRFDDPGYLSGYTDALNMVAQELEAYKDFAFDSMSFSDDELSGVTRMEGEIQQLLVDHVVQIGEEME